MSFSEQLEQDAQSLLSQEGIAIELAEDGASFEAINCIPNAGPLETRGTDASAALSHALVIAVAKLDAPNVVRNTSIARVPGAWVESGDATVDLRVSSVEMDRADPGVWLLGLD